MPGQDEAAPPQLGAAVSTRIRGNIVAHLPSMSDPDATADGGAAATPSLHDAGPAAAGAWAPPPHPPRHRPRPPPAESWPAVFGVAVAVVLIAALVAARISVNYYVFTPGDATPVAQFIEVPAADNHPLTGKILLTDVFVNQLNALNYLQYRYFDSDSQVVSGIRAARPARPTRASSWTRDTSRWPRRSRSPPRRR